MLEISIIRENTPFSHRWNNMYISEVDCLILNTPITLLCKMTPSKENQKLVYLRSTQKKSINLKISTCKTVLPGNTFTALPSTNTSSFFGASVVCKRTRITKLIQFRLLIVSVFLWTENSWSRPWWLSTGR